MNPNFIASPSSQARGSILARKCQCAAQKLSGSAAIARPQPLNGKPLLQKNLLVFLPLFCKALRIEMVHLDKLDLVRIISPCICIIRPATVGLSLINCSNTAIPLGPIPPAIGPPGMGLAINGLLCGALGAHQAPVSGPLKEAQSELGVSIHNRAPADPPEPNIFLKISC